MTTTTQDTALEEQFADLPLPIQGQLVRIARLATGMSTEEKEQARLVIGGTLISYLRTLGDDEDAHPAAEMVSACALVVAIADELSGPSASWLVG